MVPVTPVDLVVAEIYAGFQGEGPSSGTRCSFIRLGGCNLTCGWQRGPGGLTRVGGAWACDEAKTWHPGFGMRATLHRRPIPDILTAALASSPPLVVVTGGEPLIHQHMPGWDSLLAGLLQAGVAIEVETNATIVPAWTDNRVRANASPKLASSGLLRDDRLVPAALAWHAEHGSVFKFVAQAPADLDEVAEIVQVAGIPPHLVWVMPEGITCGRVLAVARQLAPAVAARGWNLTLRQHVLLYDDEGEPRDR